MSQLPSNTLQINNAPPPSKNPAANKNIAPKPTPQASPSDKITSAKTANDKTTNDSAPASFAAILEQQLKTETSSDSKNISAEISSDTPPAITAEIAPIVHEIAAKQLDPAAVVASFLQQFSQQQNVNNTDDKDQHESDSSLLAANSTDEKQIRDHKQSTVTLSDTISKQPNNSELNKAHEQLWQQTLQAQGTVEAQLNHEHPIDVIPNNINPSATPLLGSSPLSTSTANTTQAVVNTPINQPQWADDFSQQISWISTQKLSSAELQLNPANLGPVSISLEIKNDQATLSFSSPHGAVREAIENSLPKLRESLAENGITLGNTTVSDQSPREQAQQQQSAHKQTQPQTGATNPELIEKAESSGTTVLKAQQGLLNIFA